MALWTRGILVVVIGLVLSAGPARAFGAGRGGYSAAMSQARSNYQAQMKQQAAEQKEIELAEQKGAAAAAAEERRKREMHAKASRLRHEREAHYRETTIAKRKLVNAAKADSDSKNPSEAKPTSTKKP